MKLGIMQPYFFPHLGYFDLIFNVDQWVVFDQAQYIRHGWVNRNRILKPSGQWQYIIVPLKKHHRHTLIKDIQVHDNSGWKQRIIGQLQHYKKRAPFYTQTIDLLRRCFENSPIALSQLNALCLKQICEYVGIPFHYHFFSQLNLSLGPIHEPGDWALEISKAMGASLYLNPPGGKDLFDIEQFAQNNIELIIRDVPDFSYACRGYEFERNLSILDVIMWNSSETILSYLKSRTLSDITAAPVTSQR